MKNKYPCDRCEKKKYCNAKESCKRCKVFRGWVHDFWGGLEGAGERERYKRWIRTLLKRCQLVDRREDDHEH